MTITGKYVEKKNPQELLVGLKFVVATVQNDMENSSRNRKENCYVIQEFHFWVFTWRKEEEKKANLKKYAHFNFFSEFFTIVRIRK